MITIVRMTGLCLLLFCSSTVLSAAQPNPVRIEEKLGESIPDDAVFLNEKGDTVRLGDLKGQPLLLGLVYFSCPGICIPFLNGMADMLDELELEPGKEFMLVTVSFDSQDKPAAAAIKKNSLLSRMKRKIPPDSWQFFTGDSANIQSLLSAVGFHYLTMGESLAHTTALIALSPDGRIMRYLYGIEFLPFDVKMALLEASAGKTGFSIRKLVQFCYSYDPGGRKYMLNTTRIVGLSMVAVILIFFGVVLFVRRKT